MRVSGNLEEGLWIRNESKNETAEGKHLNVMERECGIPWENTIGSHWIHKGTTEKGKYLHDGRHAYDECGIIWKESIR